MPLSRFPRPGHPLAPRLLGRFLKKRDRSCSIRLADLDSNAWTQIDPKTCFALADQIIREVSRHEHCIVGELGDAPLPSIDHPVAIDDLYLEVRTFNVLTRLGVSEFPRDSASLLLSALLSQSAFGMKSLVDLLTSLEGRQTVDGQFPQRILWPVCQPGYLSDIDATRSLPAWIGCCVIPPLPDGLTLSQLALKDRTYNALERADLVRCHISLRTCRSIHC